MRYVSIDIETLGFDWDCCDVIEFGAVVCDTRDNSTELANLPTYHAYVVKSDDNYCGESFAMAMHSKILKRIATREKGFQYIPYDMLGNCFATWLDLQGLDAKKLIVAGKNFFGFDARFLEMLPNFDDHVKFFHRAIDPCNWFMRADDEFPPSLQTCLERAGINKTVNHTAVEDALDVVQLVRKGVEGGLR